MSRLARRAAVAASLDKLAAGDHFSDAQPRAVKHRALAEHAVVMPDIEQENAVARRATTDPQR